ncbi:MAG: excinuclease ABC subunit UvrC [Candidatus Omnitrophota bacterium]|nr:excinuclease ABC subunit UvrC [Candidatus Omnitrophota bacterium]
MDIKEKVRALPISPGVYIMKGADSRVLYVGKAGNLRKRVAGYFYPRRKANNERIERLIRGIKDIEYLATSTEAEALIYENSLIKQLSPKYNIALRDDKSYPMLKLTVKEKFPRLFITRSRTDDGALYYGPYANAKLLRKAVIILRQIFPLRSCRKIPNLSAKARDSALSMIEGPKSPCLDYHIKQCPAPCAGEIDELKYGEIISELKLFLEGRKDELLNILSAKMTAASRKEDFEKAAELRGRIEALSTIRKDSISYKPSGEIDELRRILRIERRPDIIEAFDVSNTMGKEAVGSMVYFYKGKPKKSEYRKFRISTVPVIDDYAMMREIVGRRYARMKEGRKALPDLILIDGGKGHLSAAIGELEKMSLSNIPVISIAKEFEHIYLKGEKEPLILPKESKALHLLKRIRDEAHRFAISYHRNLRSKKFFA